MPVRDNKPRMHPAAVVIAAIAVLLLAALVWFVHARGVPATDTPSQPFVPGGKK